MSPSFNRVTQSGWRRPSVWILTGFVGLVGAACSGGDPPKPDSGVDAEVICESGAFLGCDGTDAIFCNVEGTATARLECGQYGCNETAEQCNSCDPEQESSCDGTRRVVCDESGQEVESENCGWGCEEDAAGARCRDCEPGVACQEDLLVTCAEDGTVSSSDLCAYGCAVDRAECNACTPLMVECQSETLVSCNADGTVDESEVCDFGCSEEHLSCLCLANRSTCDEATGTLYHCGADGLPAGAEICLNGCQSSGTDAWCNDCEPSTSLCQSEQLQTCDADGQITSTVDCPLGCNSATGDPANHRCFTFTPSQLEEADLHQGTADLVVNNTTVVINTGATPPTVGGAPASSYRIVTQQLEPGGTAAANAPQLVVLRFRNISVGNGTIQVIGNRALALVASNEINVLIGDIDASANDDTPGPGGRHLNSVAWSGTPSPDGEHAQTYTGCNNEHVGAGGGGHGDAGGNGGIYYISSTPYGPKLGGAAFGGGAMYVIRGGARGGGTTSSGTYAGGGGGALMLVAGTRVSIGSWGRVDVSGGSGGLWGAGGGSGGSLLIEAPRVVIQGTVSAVGGGGSCGALEIANRGQDGYDGGNGGDCDITGTVGDGGDGGFSTNRPSATSGDNGMQGHCGAPFSDYTGGGGGGGAAGRMYIRAGLWSNSLYFSSGAELLVAPCGASAQDCAGYLPVE